MSAIELGISRMVGNAVLVTNVASNVAENLGKFPLKPGLVKASAGHAREGIQLIVGLQIIHIADGDSHSMGVARAAVCFTLIPQRPSDADWENRDIPRALDLLHDLIQVELAECIDACRDQNHVFAALDTVQSIQRI